MTTLCAKLVSMVQTLHSQAMKAQSSYSSWYFIERATIGEIRVNCTIALSSQILSSGTRRPQAADPAKQEKTLFGKAIGEPRPWLSTEPVGRFCCQG